MNVDRLAKKAHKCECAFCNLLFVNINDIRFFVQKTKTINLNLKLAVGLVIYPAH